MTRFIALTGPESTGKSTLTRALAEHFQTSFYPEYSRQYLSGKQGIYTYQDVEHIAREQIRQYDAAARSDDSLVFLDTWLIITKVWFEWVYGKAPSWLEGAIAGRPVDLFLLCRPDIPWVPDPLREHGGDSRTQLFEIYRTELLNRKFHFAEISGIGEARLADAISAVKLSL